MIRACALVCSMLTIGNGAAADELSRPALQKAMTPRMAHELFVTAFNAKNVDQLCALYAENAVVHNVDAPPHIGRKAVCESLTEFMGMTDQITIETGYELRSNDHALLRSIYQIDGKDKDGNPVTMKGSGIEVVQRQADGSWVYILDHPTGAAEIPAKSE